MWLILDVQPRQHANIYTLGRDVSARPENRASIMSLVTATGPGSTYNPEMDGQYLVVQPLLLVPLRMV